VSPGLKARLSDLLSNAQNGFEKSLAKKIFADLGSGIGATSVEFFFGPLLVQLSGGRNTWF
jgi:hypothetical protein